MKLITKAILDALASNLKKPEAERVPVVKFFGGGAGTWLISEMDEDEIMFGLCDLGMGCPELGYVSLAELKEVRFPPFGLGIERDLYFKANKTLAEYADEAQVNGRISA